MNYKVTRNVMLIGAAILVGAAFAGCGDNQDCVPVITITSARFANELSNTC